MKKFFAIVLIAGALVSCNNGADKVTENTTSDTTMMVTPSVDTSMVITDTTVKVSVDTVNKN